MTTSANLRLAFIIDAIDNATAKVRAVNKEVDKSTEPMRRARASARELFKEAGWEKLQGQMAKIRERGAGIATTIRNYAVGFAAITAAAGAAFFAIKRTVDVIDTSNDVAKKLGMNVEKFQKIGYAFQLNGAQEGDAGQVLQFLSQNMIEAVNGSKEAALWFARAGIPLAQLKKMKVDEVFEAIADKFVKVGDVGQNAAKKIALMRALMGRGGAEVRQVLDLGSEGLRKFYAEAERMGAVVDGDTAQAMADFNDNFDRLTFSIRGVMALIAKYALPHLDALVRKFTDLNVASRQEWGERIGKMIGELVTRLPGFLTSLGQITSTMASMLMAADRVAQALGGWQNVITALAVILGTKLVVQVVMFVAAIASALPTILGVAQVAWWLAAGLLSIVGLPVLIGAGLVAAAVAIWAYWEPIGKFFSDLWQTITRIGSAAGRWLNTPVFGAATPGPAVPTSTGGGRGALDGTLRIQIDSEGRATVREARRPASGALDFNVYSGMTMVPN